VWGRERAVGPSSEFTHDRPRLYKFITLAPAIFVVAVLVVIVAAFAPTCSRGRPGTEWTLNDGAARAGEPEHRR
jgi:hypothetical protein